MDSASVTVAHHSPVSISTIAVCDAWCLEADLSCAPYTPVSTLSRKGQPVATGNAVTSAIHSGCPALTARTPSHER